MSTTIYRASNLEAGQAAQGLAGQRQDLAAARSDLAQLDEWLTACEEIRMKDDLRITPALAGAIAASAVAPAYLKKHARAKHRDIGPLQEAIFVAQGQVMKRINIITENVLWTAPVKIKTGKSTITYTADPEDFRVTPRVKRKKPQLDLGPEFFNEEDDEPSAN